MAGEIEDAILAMETAQIAAKLPGVRAELTGMEAALISRVFAGIKEQTLTPQQAYYAWLELLSYRRLAQRLGSKVKMGEATMKKVAKAAADGGSDG